MKKNISLLKGLGLAAALSVSTSVLADDKEGMYSVTITNITKAQIFTPIMVASHSKGHPLYMLGSPASAELTRIAEGGDTAPMMDKLMMSGMALDTVSTGAPLFPGASVTVMVEMDDDHKYISMASMLVPTNDAIVTINGMKGPKKGMMRVMAGALDAGTEMNDESCASIPGPDCGGEPFSVADGEGYVHTHSGIHGVGDLMPEKFSFNNPVAKIMIKRMKK